MKFQKNRPLLLLLPLLLLSQSGCSLLVGNIKPVEEKSDTYGVMDLSKINPDWVRISAEETASDPAIPKGVTPTEISDVAYQAKRTASIISLNSACRNAITESAAEERKDLKAMTQVLFLGISDLEISAQKAIAIQGLPALESTAHGKLNGEDMVLRTVVLQRGKCVYDLVYMARPDYFEENEQDFAHFVASLRLK